MNLADAIRFTGYVPFADPPALYSLAEMFVFLGLRGIGPAGRRGKACGTPVIAGRTAALAEAAGAPCCRSVNSMPTRSATRSRRWRAVASVREHLAALGAQRVRLFSWSRAARETLEVYRRVANRPCPRLRQSRDTQRWA